MIGLLVSTVIQLVLIICRARWQRTRISTRSEEHGNTVGANGSDINVEKLTQAFPTALRGRCIENLVQQGDTATDSRNYQTAVEYYSDALSFEPANPVDILLKRSEARTAMGSLEKALVDAENVWVMSRQTGLDNLCYPDY